MKKGFLIAVALCMVFLMAACGAPQASAEPAETASAPESAFIPPSEEKVELTIAAAASLTDVTAEIADAYKAVEPNAELTFTYGSSGNLQTQIEQGALVDIFMSAAQKQMNALEEEGLLAEGTRSDLLENKVVLIIPAESTLDITNFFDLATDTVSMVALCDPASSPAGEYAEEVLTSLGILDTVKEKANYGSDVRQVLTWVESGNVDCGVVFLTDAATSDKVKVVCEAPEGSVKKIIYPVAVLEQSASKDAAMRFIAFMEIPDTAAIFEKYGFKMT